MVISELRQRHPRFVYESYDLNRHNGNLNVQFHFTLEPGIEFNPKVAIPIAEGFDKEKVENFAFHLGLIEAMSYWKAACPPELFVKAGRLTDQQVSWWHSLFIHGLGELYYKNGIDFTPQDFLSITSSSDKGTLPSQPLKSASGDLILVGGGKDSAVTLELLKQSERRKKALIVTPIPSAIGNARVAGYEDPIVVERIIDPKLLELNKKGYINGHTPFSAYLAFLGVFVGALNDLEHVIPSNERGATEGNTIYRGMEINHQYSKSMHFELLFRDYLAKYLSGDMQYFSFLRPLYDLQISNLFSKYPDHYSTFRSCNVGQKENSWCGECAKCAFVYLSLSPFIPSSEMVKIFGEDYFRKERIGKFITDLVGLGENKPFECVGTAEESKLAVALSIEKYRRERLKIPPLLISLTQKLGISEETTISALKERLSREWGQENFLPPEYVALLKSALSEGEAK
ncbi:MAG: hypothetical protein M1444_00765 [Patescibacteria group bacterium]|nr:hypothetical protein [Patescibacteria group bacterium]